MQDQGHRFWQLHGGECGKHCTEDARAQNQRDSARTRGKLSAEWPPKKWKRLECSSQRGSSPSINSMNRNCMSREAGDSCSYTGHAFGTLVCVCVLGEGSQWVNPDQKTVSREEGWGGLSSCALGEALFLPPYKRDGGSESYLPIG